MKKLGLSYDEEDQNNVLCSTVYHPLAQQFPPSQVYRMKFLKSLMKKVEMECHEISEKMYVAYAETVNVPEIDNDISYCTYLLDPHTSVTLEESKCIVLRGTTGFRTWEGAKILAESCLEKKSFLHKRKILELGCGSGLTGIVVCKLCRPHNYIFSDGHQEILRLLHRNIILNLPYMLETTGNQESTNDNLKTRPQLSSVQLYGDQCEHSNEEQSLSGEEKICAEFTTETSQPDVCILSLDWEAVTQKEIDSFQVDVVLAADVTYDPALIRPLVKVLHMFLSKQPQAEAWIACPLRRENTFDIFLQQTGEFGLACEEMELPKKQVFQFDRTVNIVIFRLYFKNS
ncbi:protein-lysine N-methyltransferase EEF2KMT-like isoform X2 [Limulus polyphemus]|uniref:Protein-lysine N-methyltransferase EEF2KMT-like isoform X2 n=1 Tax=Limulus polyphemus TaxID=6850 RepID=A0ABM1S3J7_LIMPO|nr:protein-lysine N-methyltransferase EEF2KMT-like isoform X2 [Limulus polyphemus]